MAFRFWPVLAERESELFALQTAITRIVAELGKD